MPPIVIRGRSYPDLNALVEDLAERGRSWILENPGQGSPADAFSGIGPALTAEVENAATELMRRAQHPGELRIAQHLGAGPHAPFYAALLDRLEGRPPLPPDADREELLQSATWVTVGRDPALRARARAVLSKEERYDLLINLLSLDDPDGDLVEVLERAVQRHTLTPVQAGAVGFVLARRAPGELPRAARALAAQPPAACDAFLDRATKANPGAVEPQVRALCAALGMN